MSSRSADASHTATDRPRVSVGLPVYNGENYLAESIASILNQTFTDFELIISDNGSTDRTEEICREFAQSDDRIRYIRHEQNRGASPNFNFTVDEARGEYFRWQAHDDVLQPTFLEKTVEVLDSDPGVSLAYSKVNRIDATGAVVGDYDFLEDLLRADDPDPHIRFGDYMCRNHSCLAAFGLVRTEEFRKTPLLAAYQGSDRILLAEMALRGRIHRVPECLFNRRDHPDAYSKDTERNPLGWWDVNQEGRLAFPTWRRLREYHHAIRRVDLPLGETLLCYAQFGRWLVSPKWYRQRWMRLFGDVFWAAYWSLSKAIRTALKKA